MTATSHEPGEFARTQARARTEAKVLRGRAVRTIADFAAADRIAVPALKVSGPALMLQMAATQQWGVEHYDKLDALALARADAAAAEALISGKGEIDAHFTRTPYADDELASPLVHRVMRDAQKPQLNVCSRRLLLGDFV